MPGCGSVDQMVCNLQFTVYFTDRLVPGSVDENSRNDGKESRGELSQGLQLMRKLFHKVTEICLPV